MQITSIQVEIKRRSKADSLDHVFALLDRARGSDLILLPEMWPAGYFNFERYAVDSESVDGPLVQTLSDKARELKAFLHIGSFVEREGSNLYNTSLLLDDRGTVIARYRKIHLFGYGSEESRLLRRGHEAVVVSTPWGVAGLSICYDLRFPELYRRLLDRGAEFFLVSAAWPQARVEAWRLFNKARALENLAYLFSCNCAGNEGESIYAGHSLLVDPHGNILAEGGDREEIVTAEVNLELGLGVRKQFPALQDRVFEN
jgi:predicted amidohydrolase